jgi:hypothetical protein
LKTTRHNRVCLIQQPANFGGLHPPYGAGDNPL